MFKAFASCAAAYLVASAVALGFGFGVAWTDPIAIAGGADVAATVAIFLFSLAYGNSSFYDPYWSVAPIAIALYWALTPEALAADGARQLAVVALVGLWGARLTYNWARGWRGLDHEDWRYVDMRRSSGRAFWPVSFLGIHLLPTILVFLGCLSLYPALTSGGAPFGALDLLAVLVTGGAIWIEARADAQLLRFRASRPEPGAILYEGLWALSRHPNYFGEMGFWWGLYLFALAADPSYWWTIAGPLAITLLFRFISLPMIEKRMCERRPEFAAHAERSSLVIPWFPR